MRISFALMVALAFALKSLGQTSFTSLDIGSQSPAGTTASVDGGFDVASSTGDIYGQGDDCRFVYQGVASDFDFVARVQKLTGTAYWAKAGIMLRHSVQDNAGEFSMLATRTSGFGYYACMSRYLTGYNSYSPFDSDLTTGHVAYPNSWVRLVRVGNQAIAQHSSNGTDWVQIGVETLYEAYGPAVVGLAVSTHTDAIGSKTTAQFRDIHLVRGLVGAPAIVTQPQSQIVNPGESLTLSVAVSGQPPLAYQWFRNGDPIPGADVGSLQLTNLSSTNAGKFSCFVTNSAGTLWSWGAEIEVVAAHEAFDGILYERFGRAPSIQFDYIVNLPSYPDSPLATSFRSFAELPSSVADFIGSRLRGYLLAPKTGLYTFWIAADDRGALWLSGDDNPATKQLIADCPYYVASRQWNSYGSQQSSQIHLEAGQRYYVEGVFKEADGPDNGAIGWQLPDGTLERPIPVARFRGAQATLSVDHSLAGRLLSVAGTSNSPYILLQSSNLLDWTPVITNRAPFQFDVLTNTTDPAQFYRATSER